MHDRIKMKIRLATIGIVMIILGVMVLSMTTTAKAEFTGSKDVGFYITNENHVAFQNCYVTVESMTKEQSKKVTDESGACHFELNPGKYDIKIESEGYKTLERKIYVGDDTTYTYSMKKGTEDIDNWWYLPLVVIVIFCIIMAVALFGPKIMKEKRKGRNKIQKGGLISLVLALLVIATVSNSGCISLDDRVGRLTDENALYCGEDKWFITELDFEVYVKAYNSYAGPPRDNKDNKATRQLASDYIVRITPITPKEAESRYKSESSDANGDGVPDGFQTNTNFALGVDGIYESIVQGCNGVGYDGDLYNNIPKDNKHFQPAKGINPQTETKAGIRTSSGSRGVFEDIFLGGMNRPFLKLSGNFRDKFFEETIYVTVPVSVDIRAEGKITGREIYSTQVDCPVFVHVPPPGQDRETTEHLRLELFTPLDFIGGGLVEITPHGSEIRGHAWMNVRTNANTFQQIFQDWKSAVENYLIGLALLGIAGGLFVGALFFPPLAIVGLVTACVGAWLLWDTYSNQDPSQNIDDYTFIPGVGWHFDNGILKGLQEWAYNVNPAVTDPDN